MLVLRGADIRAFLRRRLRALRANWPNTEIRLCGDGHYACPAVLDWCGAARIACALGVPTSRTLRRHVTTLEASTAARFQATPGADKVRRGKEFYDGASTWRAIRRIVARVEAEDQGTDTRFALTNLRHGPGR